MKNLNIKITPKPKDYDICIGYNYLDNLVNEIYQNHKDKKICIVTDKKVNKTWGKALGQALNKREIEHFIVEFPAGEKYKNRETKEAIEEDMLEKKCSRDTILIAFGGGVVGDVSGFVASTYMRGITYYQVPTTTLAQADSSIGGKTAVDTKHGKNLIGTFYHPHKVFIDTKLLTTLDNANYIGGLVEVFKHAIIFDEKFFEFLNESIEDILSRKDQVYENLLPGVLFQNCKIKKEIVSLDPEEKGLRKILNFGHTIGHAVELLTDFKQTHGQAVALGMICEGFIGWKLGILKESDYLRIYNTIEKLGVVEQLLLKDISAEDLYGAMMLDKKVRNKMVEFVMISQIGKIINEITFPISKADIIKIIDDFKRHRFT